MRKLSRRVAVNVRKRYSAGGYTHADFHRRIAELAREYSGDSTLDKGAHQAYADWLMNEGGMPSLGRMLSGVQRVFRLPVNSKNHPGGKAITGDGWTIAGYDNNPMFDEMPHSVSLAKVDESDPNYFFRWEAYVPREESANLIKGFAQEGGSVPEHIQKKLKGGGRKKTTLDDFLHG